MKDAIKYFKIIVLIVCFTLFCLILNEVLLKEVTTYDRYVYDFVSNHFIKECNHNLMKAITFFGSTLGIILMALLAIILVKKKRNKIAIATNLVLIVAINKGLKNIVCRPRPNILRIVEETGYSFPSGHSMVSLSFYGLLLYIICKNVNKKYLNILLIFSGIILIIAIGFSRIYLGVHYFSDVLAGFLGAIVELILFITIFNRVGDKFEK